MATNKDGLSPLEQMIAQRQGITEGQYLQMHKALCEMPSRYFPEVHCDTCPKELPQDSGEAHYWNDGSEDLRLCSACYEIAESLPREED